MAYEKFNWASVAELLGVWPDSSIARRLGCSTLAVYLQREKRGIASPSKLGPARQFQVRLPEPLYEQVVAVNKRRQAAGRSGTISCVVRDALIVGLSQL